MTPMSASRARPARPRGVADRRWQRPHPDNRDAGRLCARGNHFFRLGRLQHRLAAVPHWRPHVRLREFFADDAITLELKSTAKDDVLKELVGLLHLDERSEQTLVKMLKRRETLGSTGIGQNIAIPHCRALAVNSLRVAFGRKLEGIDFNAIDGKPVHYFFLIVAPPLEVSNQYLPVLGKIAQFAKEADVPDKLAKITTPQEFLKLLEDKNI